MTKDLEGIVATILSSTQIAINKGFLDGVRPGMIFQILDSTGREIIDPISKKFLGNVLLPKSRIKIVTVEDLFSIAKKSAGASVSQRSTRLFGAESADKDVFDFASSKAQVNELSWVSVGDKVRLITSNSLDS